MRQVLCSPSNFQHPFNRIIERDPDRGADQHFDPGDHSAVFGVPVIAVGWRDANDRDARVVDAAGEPGLEDGLLELLDLGLVLRDGRVAFQVQEVGVGRALEI